MAHLLENVLEYVKNEPVKVALVATGVLVLGGLGVLKARLPDVSIADAVRLAHAAVFKSPHKSLFMSPPSKEHILLQTVLQTAREGDPLSVLSVIDKFGYEHWMMNLGDKKGEILDGAIKQHSPLLMIELGAYCGYSAVRSARLLRPEAKLISIEFNALCSAIATKVVEHAGLGDRVRVLNGNVESVLPRVRAIMAQMGKDKIDLIFIDHEKSVYLKDLLLMESAGLIRKGTVVVADNVICPGAPDYLVYVRAASHYKTTMYEQMLEYQDKIRDGVEVSVCVADPVPTAQHPQVKRAGSDS